VQNHYTLPGQRGVKTERARCVSALAWHYLGFGVKQNPETLGRADRRSGPFSNWATALSCSANVEAVSIRTEIVSLVLVVHPTFLSTLGLLLTAKGGVFPHDHR